VLTRRWYAWPRLRPRFRGTLGAGAALGLLWGLWHLPVIDHLGVHPHGVDWAPVAAAFIAAVAVLDPGMRAAAGLQPAGRRDGGWR
jgi:hypothetical protein